MFRKIPIGNLPCLGIVAWLVAMVATPDAALAHGSLHEQIADLSRRLAVRAETFSTAIVRAVPRLSWRAT